MESCVTRVSFVDEDFSANLCSIPSDHQRPYVESGTTMYLQLFKLQAEHVTNHFSTIIKPPDHEPCDRSSDFCAHLWNTPFWCKCFCLIPQTDKYVHHVWKLLHSRHVCHTINDLLEPLWEKKRTQTSALKLIFFVKMLVVLVPECWNTNGPAIDYYLISNDPKHWGPQSPLHRTSFWTVRRKMFYVFQNSDQEAWTENCIVG